MSQNLHAETDNNVIAALNARTKMTRAESAKLLGSEVHGSIWYVLIERLCFNHRTVVDGSVIRPNSNDVRYNLITYSHVAMQRLSYGRPYVESWRDPMHAGPLVSNRTYLVIMSVGFITWGTYDSITKQMNLRLGDCEVQIPLSRLLAINTVIDDAQDFMRGVAIAPYAALENIKCSTTKVDMQVPGKRSKTNSKPSKSKLQRTARRRNR